MQTFSHTKLRMPLIKFLSVDRLHVKFKVRNNLSGGEFLLDLLRRLFWQNG